MIILLTCLLFTFPIAMILLFTGDIYRKKNGGWQPIKTSSRMVYGSLLALWLVALVAKQIVSPTTLKEEIANNQVVESQSRAETGDAGQPPEAPTNAIATCDAADTIEAVKSALEGAGGPMVTVSVVDFGNAKEFVFDQEKQTRHCLADAVLNTGQTLVTYQIYRGPSGKLIVAAQTGEEAQQMHVRTQAIKFYIDNPAEAARVRAMFSGERQQETPAQENAQPESEKPEAEQQP